ncbi:MAG: hypothetical protein GDA48_12975 [Hormoscilla sp. GM102CHS1]|nr:hypothetical protein [Hormoscilla sp. GM102CHS1]
MSGGPILDEKGDVVGINGLGFQEPNTEEWEFFGIPINTYKSWHYYVLADIFKGHFNTVYSVAISPDGQLLASGSYDKTIKIWNLGSGRLLRTLTGHSDWVKSVAISPDGQLLASGSWDDTIKIWNLGSGRLLRTLTGHSDWVRSVAFSPDGQTIVSGGGCSLRECKQDFDIRIWRARGR